MSVQDTSLCEKQLDTSGFLDNSNTFTCNQTRSINSSHTLTTENEMNKQSGDKSHSQNVTKGRSCKFFFSAKGCGLGELCKYSHALPEEMAAAVETSSSQLRSDAYKQSETTARNTRPTCKFFAAGYCKWGQRCAFFHSRPAYKPKNTDAAKLEDKRLTDLTEFECKSLAKSEINHMKKRYPKRMDIDDRTFQILFKPTDPDWPYDVKSIHLELSFPELYPQQVMAVSIYNEGCLPGTLAKYLVKKMSDWLAEQYEESTSKNKVTLVLKPFLKWLDRSMEDLFTEGLLIYKREIAAKAAGFSFVNPNELREMYPNATDSRNNSDEEDHSDTQTDNSQSEDGEFSEEQNKEISDLTDAVNQVDTGSEEATASQNKNSKLDPAKRGTELRLKNLQLLESTGTLHCTVLRIGLRCSRCKTVHHVSLHPERPYVVVCDKCRSNMSIIFHASLMHVGSCTAGYFDLDGCQPFDLVLQDCQLIASCIDCSGDNVIHGLFGEQLRTFWCLTCHKKMSLSAEKGSFIILNDGLAIKIGADAVVIAKKAKLKTDLKILAEGKPLPSNGACQHYKKSYRWFRFPCCGKLYPCDTCHDEKEFDHEMQLATRMVCGFCSKEQTVSATKPCVSCEASVTRSKTQHWEGGHGCRNKIYMSRNDKQKFSGSNKTVSKKAVSEQKKSGKKTTSVRHAK